MLRHRPHLLWPLVPFVLFLVALPRVNRAEPVTLGLPFLSGRWYGRGRRYGRYEAAAGVHARRLRYGAGRVR
ncbi:hypothetical protein [Streptomyces scopuliridis]|uniref:hypothetical protein n=1 Tax=Streptomyces scopuliridis TaxID=452529 RepID=UPI00369899D3